MENKRHHEWFVWPKDAHTNEVIARFGEGGTYGFESDALKDCLCADGQKRNLWRTSEQSAWYLWRSRGDLKFHVFNRLGAGKIKDVTFLFRKDKRSPKKKKQAQT